MSLCLGWREHIPLSFLEYLWRRGSVAGRFRGICIVLTPFLVEGDPHCCGTSWWCRQDFVWLFSLSSPNNKTDGEQYGIGYLQEITHKCWSCLGLHCLSEHCPHSEPQITLTSDLSKKKVLVKFVKCSLFSLMLRKTITYYMLIYSLFYLFSLTYQLR